MKYYNKEYDTSLDTLLWKKESKNASKTLLILRKVMDGVSYLRRYAPYPSQAERQGLSEILDLLHVLYKEHKFLRSEEYVFRLPDSWVAQGLEDL